MSASRCQERAAAVGSVRGPCRNARQGLGRAENGHCPDCGRTTAFDPNQRFAVSRPAFDPAEFLDSIARREPANVHHLHGAAHHDLRHPGTRRAFRRRVAHVLSILGPNSPDLSEFDAFVPHRRLILRFHDVIEPQPDQIAPTRQDVECLSGMVGIGATLSLPRTPAEVCLLNPTTGAEVAQRELVILPYC